MLTQTMLANQTPISMNQSMPLSSLWIDHYNRLLWSVMELWFGLEADSKFSPWAFCQEEQMSTFRLAFFSAMPHSE
jgi:hypothetical protein